MKPVGLAVDVSSLSYLSDDASEMAENVKEMDNLKHTIETKDFI